MESERVASVNLLIAHISSVSTLTWEEASVISPFIHSSLPDVWSYVYTESVRIAMIMEMNSPTPIFAPLPPPVPPPPAATLPPAAPLPSVASRLSSLTGKTPYGVRNFPYDMMEEPDRPTMTQMEEDYSDTLPDIFATPDTASVMFDDGPVSTNKKRERGADLDSVDGSNAKRRGRAQYTVDQLQLLTRVYNQTPKPDGCILDDLSFRFKKTRRQVQVWFSNKRQRELGH